MRLENYEILGIIDGVVLELHKEENTFDIDPLEKENASKKKLVIGKVLSVGAGVPEEISVGNLVVGENWGMYSLGDNRYIVNYHNLLGNAKRK